MAHIVVNGENGTGMRREEVVTRETCQHIAVCVDIIDKLGTFPPNFRVIYFLWNDVMTICVYMGNGVRDGCN